MRVGPTQGKVNLQILAGTPQFPEPPAKETLGLRMRNSVFFLQIEAK